MVRNIFTARPRSKDETAEEIRMAIAGGLTTPEEIAERIGTSVRYVLNLCSNCAIRTPFQKTFHYYYKRKGGVPARDTLLDKGLSIPELGQLWGMKSNSVNVYILRSGKHLDWKQIRKKWGGLHRELKKSDASAYQSVLDYLSIYPFTLYPIPALHKLFHRASELESEGYDRFRKLDDEFYLDSGESAEIYRTAREARKSKIAA